MFDPVADTVFEVAFKHHFSGFVEGGLCGVYLGEDILAGNVLVNHPVDGLDLSDDFCKPAVQVCGVHTLFHNSASIL